MKSPLRALVVCGFGLLAVLLLAGAAAPHDVVMEPNVAMQTRDGVTLRADVFRPKGEGRYPVIMIRTPYGRTSNITEGFKGAAKGYVFIVQDVRGREGSDGEWYPFKHEANDGYDAVEWAAKLPASNGKVAIMGGSYPGVAPMQAAVAAPPSLVAIFPEITGSNYYAHWAYQGGAFEQGLATAWAGALALDEAKRKMAGSAQMTYWDIKAPLPDYPMIDTALAKSVSQFYRDWLAHPTYDDYWKQWSIEERFEKIQVPACHIAAWYDIFQDGGIRNYVGIKKRGGSEAARRGQRLVVIPGGHAGWGTKIGEVEFGPGAKFSTWDHAFRFFDLHLKGIDDGLSKEKPVKIFVMGENVFRDEDEWPLARAVATPYYLRSGGKANSLSGDGRLSPTPPGDEPADRFVYDPNNPVPTHGGATLGIPFAPPGPFDQRVVEGREDILVYTSDAFTQPFEVTGPLAVELWVSSSAVDTDLVAKLVDVYPDGRAINLSEGILRLRYRNSFERPELMTPGQPYKVVVDLWSTANVFLPGHKLRVEVTSSSFPRFSRNMNHGGNPESSKVAVVATNVIYHDEARPSAIILPVVPR